MRIDPIKPAASAAGQPPMAGAAGRSHTAAYGGVAAKIYGPLTTHRMTGAGGPFNSWDNRIANLRDRGQHEHAAALQAARAKFNVAFLLLEPVWVPTNGQRGMLGLQAGAAAHGIAIAKAA